MKYIATRDDNGKEEVFVFPKVIDYDGMAEVLNYIKNQVYGNWRRIPRKPVSAGFVDRNWKCYGKCESLGLESRDVDSEILKKQLNENKGLKYILTVDENNNEDVFVFPNIVHHDAMAEMLEGIGDRNNEELDGIFRKPVSAGFVDRGWHCHGISESLGLKSRAKDTGILVKQLGD